MNLNSPRDSAIAMVLLLTASAAATAQEQPTTWPNRVLITNDNGIDDPKIHALARAFSQVAETWVFAADQDRSGTTNMMAAIRAGEIHVQRRELGEGVEAFAVQGYPADCVLFGLAGPLRDRLPDLVISGINGGENLGDDWFGSGTIGAARAAAYFGLPAMAVSGLDDGNPDAVATAVDWVVRLAQSEIVRSLERSQYLTVSLPRVHPSEVSGVEVVERARGLVGGRARKVAETADGSQTWRFDLEVDHTAASDQSDVAAVLERSAIAIVPMRAGEADPQALAGLQSRLEKLPDWSFDPASSTAPRCPSGLGIVFDDAEDSSGREWAVIVEEVLAGGRAEQLGIRVGDVVTKLNGTALEVPRRSAEDPDDLFLRLLRELDCGDRLALEIVRGVETLAVDFVLE
ncbi:MAG: 5'/3'-nucleotidase SurE [Pseudomonadota bacterium]